MENQTIVLFEDESWKIYRDASDGLMTNYKDSCRYKVAANESPIIEYLCSKIKDLSNSK
jgi:hypothetical protein